MTLPVITPNWNAPDNIVAFTTTTAGGVSQQTFASLNLGNHVGDKSENVVANRAKLQRYMGSDVTLCWLQQTHSDIVVNVNDYTGAVEGDAAVANTHNQACIVMTADCLPVLLASADGTTVAALHCGWKGLYQQLITKTIHAHFQGREVIAWLGPAIAPASYEIDAPFYQRFIQLDAGYHTAFVANRPGHYWCDLYAIARHQLAQAGVDSNQLFGGDFDTLTDPRFFSHRQHPQSGRMASVIYLRD